MSQRTQILSDERRKRIHEATGEPVCVHASCAGLITREIQQPRGFGGDLTQWVYHSSWSRRESKVTSAVAHVIMICVST